MDGFPGLPPQVIHATRPRRKPWETTGEGNILPFRLRVLPASAVEPFLHLDLHSIPYVIGEQSSRERCGCIAGGVARTTPKLQLRQRGRTHTLLAGRLPFFQSARCQKGKGVPEACVSAGQWRPAGHLRAEPCASGAAARTRQAPRAWKGQGRRQEARKGLERGGRRALAEQRGGGGGAHVCWHCGLAVGVSASQASAAGARNAPRQCGSAGMAGPSFCLCVAVGGRPS